MSLAGCSATAEPRGLLGALNRLKNGSELGGGWNLAEDAWTATR